MWIVLTFGPVLGFETDEIHSPPLLIPSVLRSTTSTYPFGP
ncbi:hypothetical protein [Natronococcus wangiae]|nr:hypothetical protein [Natronococcus sp. AD5]